MATDLSRLKCYVLFLCLFAVTFIAVRKILPDRISYAVYFQRHPNNASAQFLFEISNVTTDLDNGTVAEVGKNSTQDLWNFNATVAVSGCGDRLSQAVFLVKSILISSLPKRHVKVYFFTEQNQHDKARLELEKLANSSAFRDKSISLHIMAPAFPAVGNETAQNIWRTMWRPCATQRLFLSDVLSDEDGAIYVDSDTRFVAPIQLMWRHFSLMNSSQVMGMAAEHELESLAWYKKDRKPPHVEPLGVNSGVLLMNLTRMRAMNFTEHLLINYEKYQKELVFHDQDLLNIQFNQHPEQLYLLPCSWNYRCHHCQGGISNCPAAEREGVMLIHGNVGTLYAGTQLQVQFNVINSAIERFSPAEDLGSAFREPLRTKLLATPVDNHCRMFYLQGLSM